MAETLNEPVGGEMMNDAGNLCPAAPGETIRGSSCALTHPLVCMAVPKARREGYPSKQVNQGRCKVTIISVLWGSVVGI